MLELSESMMFRLVLWPAAILSLSLFLCAQASQADVTLITDAEGRTVATYASSHALVIGVSDYTAGWKDLPSIPGEIEQVAGALEAQGFTVETVSDPGKERLTSAIESFVNAHGYTPDNRLLIFFAGHGYSRVANGVQRGYLVPANAPLPTPGALPQFLAKAVPMLDIEGWARKIEARHVLFVFDSCFSGSVLDARSGVPAPSHIDTLTGRRVRQFLTAGSAGEEVPGKSLFTPAFIKALAGPGDLTGDGYVTGTELGLYLHQLIAGRGQTPQHGRLLGYHEGDFVFRLAIEPPPMVAGFDVSDLEERSDLESRWSAYQLQMEDAFSKAEGLESLGGTASTKAAAWERFLTAFESDNPFSEADEDLRQQAASRLAHWRSQPVAQPSGDVVPTTIAEQPSAGDAMAEPVLNMRFRYIPSGTFVMGSPESEEGRWDGETQHEVTLTRGFWMGETEVTQGQWRSLMGSDPSSFSQCGDLCPVERVSWYEAVAFANAMSERANLEVCYEVSGGNGNRPGEGLEYVSVQFKGFSCSGYRLPTESEWEFAARSGSSTALYTGPLTIDGDCDSSVLDEIGWYCGNSGVRYGGGHDCSGWPERQDSSSASCGPHPVGEKTSNPWGLHDMLGNVWEWTWDWFAAYPTDPQPNPVGPSAGSYRVLRGCSWSYYARNCRSAIRNGGSPGNRSRSAGFRLVRQP